LGIEWRPPIEEKIEHAEKNKRWNKIYLGRHNPEDLKPGWRLAQHGPFTCLEIVSMFGFCL